MTYLKWRVMKILPIPEKWKLSVRYSLIQWTVLARRRREKIISFTLDKDETLIWSLWPWNHLLAWGGLKILSRRGGQKMASRGGRLAIYPPTHTYALRPAVSPPLLLKVKQLVITISASNSKSCHPDIVILVALEKVIWQSPKNKRLLAMFSDMSID